MSLFQLPDFAALSCQVLRRKDERKERRKKERERGEGGGGRRRRKEEVIHAISDVHIMTFLPLSSNRVCLRKRKWKYSRCSSRSELLGRQSWEDFITMNLGQSFRITCYDPLSSDFSLILFRLPFVSADLKCFRENRRREHPSSFENQIVQAESCRILKPFGQYTILLSGKSRPKFFR